MCEFIIVPKFIVSLIIVRKFHCITFVQFQSENCCLMQALDVKTRYFIYTCSSNGIIQLIILPTLFAYKGLLQLIALYFAFKTRTVNVKGLDDSKYIAFVVYIFSIFWVVFIVSVFALSRYTNTYAAVVASSALVCATSLLIIVFIPKVSEWST